MKRAALAFLLVFGCGDGSSNRLTGEWIDQLSGSTALGLTFNADGTYDSLSLLVTSATSTSVTADVEAEGGTFSSTADTITFMPTASSCPGPIPVYSSGYSFSGANLVISFPAGSYLFAPNNGPNSGTTGSLRFGCFANGVLTPRPLAPVSN